MRSRALLNPSIRPASGQMGYNEPEGAKLVIERLPCCLHPVTAPADVNPKTSLLKSSSWVCGGRCWRASRTRAVDPPTPFPYLVEIFDRLPGGIEHSTLRERSQGSRGRPKPSAASIGNSRMVSRPSRWARKAASAPSGRDSEKKS